MEDHNLERLIFNQSLPFEKRALQVYQYQYNHVDVYKEFCDQLHRTPTTVSHIEQIPFLPVEMFKFHRIVADNAPAETIFRSSGTTGQTPSQHLVKSTSLYKTSILNGFHTFFGNPAEYCFLALLPSYLERQDASLVYMAKTLMNASAHPYNGFYLHEFNELSQRLKQLEERKQPVVLLGVTFALLDLAEQFPQKLNHTKIVETGGMKGRRKEMIRAELHDILQSAFGVKQIFSEYGMTEMLSQAYYQAEGRFYPANTLHCLTREITDPFQMMDYGKTGVLNVIDLANLYSCSFLATQDLGKVYEDGSFDVLGRTDSSEIRGCNLMVE